MTPSGVLRYWHTVRHLKPVQLYGRVLFLLRRPTADLRPAPTRRRLTGRWVSPAPKPVSLLGPTEVRLLGRSGNVRRASDWNDAGVPKLWLYNLHYFDDLSAARSEERVAWQRALIVRWMAENPAGEGNGWEPYPTSLRIVNWVKWALAGEAPPDGFEHSLAVQARWLSRRIEHHLLANHLLVNAKALIVAGAWFAGAEAERWMRTGLALLARELPEQLYGDGGHVEGSPMYHALLLEDLLDLLNLAAAAPDAVAVHTVSTWQAAAVRMHGWLLAMAHPDGEIAFFNDSAFGVASAPAALGAYADRLGVILPTRPGALSDSGYVRVERGDATLLADLAPVGADYQPAHAHADTLSFEWSLGDQRIVVNSGTSTYEAGPQRAFERSTAAHSTVALDGADSSEVWDAFRVARRARPIDVTIERDAADAVVRASHDGYCRLPGRPLHTREWRLSERQLVVTDRVTSDRRAVARFYLHPEIAPATDGVLRLPNGRVCRWRVTGGTSRVHRTRWFPRFGASRENLCIEVVLAGPESRMEFRW